eukprot:TRINITY_DN1879_c0_g2_i1.p4 TRINITY_DN1879_c0_g2~~TRINITY_DN1879_c0_g2_i1.p4  ORF type:complete len:109 (-),score=41.08 TRINITY_DN1879_c0_g2_i1:10-336(-)
MLQNVQHLQESLTKIMANNWEQIDLRGLVDYNEEAQNQVNSNQVSSNQQYQEQFVDNFYDDQFNQQDYFYDESLQNQKDGYFDYSTSCLLYTSPSPRDVEESRMPSSA